MGKGFLTGFQDSQDLQDGLWLILKKQNPVNHVNPVKIDYYRISGFPGFTGWIMEQEELTEAIIACAYKVHNILGFGFLEKVYENSLKIELIKQGFEVQQQYPISVFYDEQLVGDFYADLFVNNSIILELKAVDNLAKPHEVQLVNYLKATNMEIGLLINFGRSVQVKRKYKDPVKRNYTGLQDLQD